MSDRYIEDRDIDALRAINDHGPATLQGLIRKGVVDFSNYRLKKAGRRLRKAGYARYVYPEYGHKQHTITAAGKRKLAEDPTPEVITAQQIEDATG